jgi:hypothetical protein
MRGTKWVGKELSAAEAATRLQMSRERVVRLVQSGQLAGRRDDHQGWLVKRYSLLKLEDVLRARRRMAGKGGGRG